MAADPHRFAPVATWDRIRLRAWMARKVRGFFEERDFLEVETPLLSPEVVPEPHIEPVRVESGPHTRWLQASPEAHMKRMFAAGSGPIFQITRSFRGGEVGPHHNPEFSILEWYRSAASVDDGIDLLAEFCRHMTGHDPCVVSYRDCFLAHAGVDPIASTTEQIATAAAAKRCPIAATDGSWNRDELLDGLLVHAVEPHLAGDTPWIVRDYPVSQAALAAVSADEHGDQVADRFELYWEGVELANGYFELTDPAELRRRIERTLQIRQASNCLPLPTPEGLYAALDHGLPPSAGVAVGLDRLAMLLARAESLAEVMPFPWE